MKKLARHLLCCCPKTPTRPPLEFSATPIAASIMEHHEEHRAESSAETPPAPPVVPQHSQLREPISEPIPEHHAESHTETPAGPPVELPAEPTAEPIQVVEPSSAETSTEFTMQIDSIREKFGRFRVLIIGRPNAGKTMILKQICNSTEDPVIYDRNRNEVDPEIIQESSDRGIHDIWKELVFRGNPGFVFHDSQGFESGSIEEFEQTKAFVLKHAKTAFLKERIHAIWYCIPMDQYHRAVLAAEEKFFGECDTGSVPVVLVFTKCDALLVQGIAALTPEEQKLPYEERTARGQDNADAMLKKNPAWEKVQGMKYPPKTYVELKDMDKSKEGCELLLKRTLVTLDGELQMLLVTTQQTNMMICIEYAIERKLMPFIRSKHKTHEKLTDSEEKELVEAIAAWFPHVKVYNFFTI
ncbi:hypothetical protein JVU11DRAFT_12919 [Chiua virens]|nr:hypothetical protein JVU11DRAFT_12919 [Chiua virens]